MAWPSEKHVSGGLQLLRMMTEMAGRSVIIHQVRWNQVGVEPHPSRVSTHGRKPSKIKCALISAMAATAEGEKRGWDPGEKGAWDPDGGG